VIEGAACRIRAMQTDALDGLQLMLQPADRVP